MKHTGRATSMPWATIEALEPRLLLSGFTAYNDALSGPGTHDNTTLWADNPGGDSAGQLKDILTGDDTPVHLSTSAVGINWGGQGANPADGTDAADIFGGYVDFLSVSGNNSVEVEAGDSYTYVFDTLDPGNTYEFAGTAVRGSSSYTNRWTLVTLEGADGFTADHSTGNGVVAYDPEAPDPPVAANQVALWTGHNSAAGQGFVARWTDIEPGPDGEFSVISTQYTGPTPGVGSGTANGTKGYGLAGIRLIEDVPSAPPAVVNTPATNIEAFAAEIGGQITNTGGQAPDVTIYYGQASGGTDPGSWDHSIALGPQAGTFSQVVTGLLQGTTYHFTSFAENSIGSAWAPSAESFATLAATAPSVVNLPATQIGAFSALLAGEVTDTGNESPLVTVYYGQADGGASPGAWTDSIELDVQSGPFAAAVEGLDPETTYYFTAYARNAMGNDWATPSRSFRTTEAPPLEITEFMADNDQTLHTRTRTDDGDPFVGDTDDPDWIEIHNPSDATVVLNGYHLTDDLLGYPRQWAFPDGMSLAPAGDPDGKDYLVVFASGNDVTDPNLDENGFLHTNFKLKDGGDEDVALTDVDGLAVFAYENYPVQDEDVSYGIDSEGVERFFTMPTPGWDNANDVPKSPQFTVAGTTFTDSVVVDLTAAYPTDTIHYTLNESVPNATSPVWAGPLTVTDTTMIRAASIGTNGKASRVVSETHIELGADVLDSSSNLPIVIVETFGDGVPGKSSGFGDSFMAVFAPGLDGRTRLTDPFVVDTRAGIHIRGSSSAGFSKKQYRVEFWDESNEDRRLDLLGMPGEADWVFYGPGSYDRALINNPFIYDLSNQVGRYAVRTQWVEMYLNANGGEVTAADYVGVYAVMEFIESGDNRVDVEGLSSGAGGVPVDGGFAWKKDKTGTYIEPEDPNSAQRSYIDGYINTLNSAATGEHTQWADLDSLVDHNLLNMIAMNVDALRWSTYYYKTRDGKLEAGPIWDFDRALDSTDGRDNNPSWWNGTGDSTMYFNDNSRVMNWWPGMFQDPDFVQMYVDRWFELRENEFSLDNLYATIDAHAAQLAEAAPRDYARWSGSRYGDFAGEMQHMKDWLTTRVNWIDSQWLSRPTFDIAGPVVTPGTTVTLSSPAGQVYYTTDGTDPRAPGGGVSGGAVPAAGAIAIDQYTKITARVFLDNHGPTTQGYIPSGDDWSAPVVGQYFVNPLAAAGDVVITEVNYNPYDPTPAELALDAGLASDDFEFIELHNVSGHLVNICGVRFADGVRLTFDSHVLAAGQRVVVAANQAAFEARYGTGIALEGQYGVGPDAMHLSNTGENVTLDNTILDATILDFAYNDSGDWPGRADGKGAALEIIDPAADYNDPDNWRSSVAYGGTPGAAPQQGLGVVVNEVLTHTDLPDTDTIELHNTTGGDIDIGGWYLSDSWGWASSADNGDYKKFRIPDDTIILAGRYVTFNEYDFNLTGLDENPDNDDPKDFALSGAYGDDVWLMRADPDGTLTHFADHVQFQAAANGESFGRWPDGSGRPVPMADLTFGSVNTGPRIGPVVISEVHYHPENPDGPGGIDADDLEFIEIVNPTDQTAELWETYHVDGHWRDYSWTVEGFAFATGTALTPGERLVVVPFDPDLQPTKLADFETHYGIAGAGVRIVGPYDGQLDNTGETVRLERPDAPPAEAPAFVPALIVDEVIYDDQAPWPAEPDTDSMSLNRISAIAWGNDPASWVARAPTPGQWSDTGAPTLEAWFSAADHDGTERLLEIPNDGSFSEPRSAGIKTLVLQFSEAVNLALASVALAGINQDGQMLLTGIPPTISARAPDRVQIVFDDRLADIARYVIRLDGVMDLDDNALVGDADRIMTALLGDTDGDLTTDVSDLGYAWDTRGRAAEAGAGQTRSDVDLSATVGTADMLLVWDHRGADTTGFADPVLQAPAQSQAQADPQARGYKSLGSFVSFEQPQGFVSLGLGVSSATQDSDATADPVAPNEAPAPDVTAAPEAFVANEVPNPADPSLRLMVEPSERTEAPQLEPDLSSGLTDPLTGEAV